MNLTSAVIHNAKVLGIGTLALNTQRRIAVLLAHYQKENGLVEDGKYGPETERVLNGLLADYTRPTEALPIQWAPFNGPLVVRPRTRAEIRAMFGNPDKDGALDKQWEKDNIVRVHGEAAFLPVLAETWFPVHKMLEPYFREAFMRAETSAPGYIQRPGTFGFVFRHTRHDPDLPLSLHSWGIACDINPKNNSAKFFEPGETPEPWSQKWWNTWPNGMPKAVVDAFTSCGFSWGGYWKGFADPMHFEWCGRREVQV